MKHVVSGPEINSVNCPDRLSLDSYADTDRAATADYSSFTNNLGVAILGAKQLCEFQLPEHEGELPQRNVSPVA